MKKLGTMFLWVGVLGIFLYAGPATADEPEGKDWRAVVNELKKDARLLMQENRVLNDTYNVLQGELQAIQVDVTDLRTTIQQQEMEQEARRHTVEQKMKAASRAEQEIQNTPPDLEALKAENAQLREAYQRLQEANAATVEQAARLERKESDVRLKMDEFKALRQQESRHDPELEKLERRLLAKQKENEVLQQELKTAEVEVAALPDEIEEMEQGNTRLETEIRNIQEDIRRQEQENVRLKREKERLAASVPLPQKLLKEKQQLESDVVSLENELETIQNSLEETNLILQKKRWLMDQIMAMDAENQKLRQEVDNLMADIAAIESGSDGQTVRP